MVKKTLIILPLQEFYLLNGKPGAISIWVNNFLKLNYDNLYVLVPEKKDLIFDSKRVRYFSNNLFFSFLFKIPFLRRLSDSLFFFFNQNIFKQYDRIIIHNSIGLLNKILNLHISSKVYFHLHNDYISSLNEGVVSNNKIAKIFLCSSFLQAKFVEKFPLWESKSAIIYNGFDISFSVNKKTNIRINKYRICYLGRIDNNKNLIGVLEVFDLLTKQSNSFELIVVGAAGTSFSARRYYKKCIQLANKIMHENNVSIIFKGFQDHLNALTILNECDLLLSMVKFNEAFGMALLEAQMLKVPLLVHDIAGVRSVVFNDVFLINSLEPRLWVDRITYIKSNPRVISVYLEKIFPSEASHLDWNKIFKVYISYLNSES